MRTVFVWARPARTVPLFRFFSVLAVCLWVLGAQWGQAQTARFVKATTSVGSVFSNPISVAVDRAGDVFVANDSVYEIVAVNGAVSSSSQVKTVGGGFYDPQGVAVDGAGDVLVADTYNGAVKEIVAVNGVVSSSSQVKTVGSGFAYPAAVAVDGAGDVFVTDLGNNMGTGSEGTGSGTVYEIVAVNGVVSSSSQVNAVGNGFIYPTGVAVDGAGNVWVADSDSIGVYEIVAVDGVVSSSSPINPMGGYGIAGPYGVAVDGAGDVFVADYLDDAVYEIVAVNGVVSPSAQVNLVESGFSYPYAVAVDGAGDVFVADTGNKVVDELQQNGVVKFGPAAVATTTPTQATLDFSFTAAGTIGAPVVLTEGATGKDFTDAGTGSCTTNGTSYSYAIGASCSVNVKFTPAEPGQRLGAVQLRSNSGTVIATTNLYGTGTGPMLTFPGNPTVNTLPSGFSSPKGVAVDGAGDVFVADTNGDVVKEIVAVSGVVSSGSTVNSVGSGFSGPTAVAVDGAGDVFVADYGNNAVKEIMAVNGVVSFSSPVNTVGGGFSDPYGVAVDGAGDVFVADYGNNAVKEIVAVNGVVSASSTVNIVGGGFSSPQGVAVDGAGDVFVTENTNSAAQEIVAVNGMVSASSQVIPVGSGLSSPTELAVDAAGDVFVADYGNNAVKEIVAVNGVVSSSSQVNTVGSGFTQPAGVALDGVGDVFVADYGDNAVKELPLSVPPAVSFPATSVGASSSAQSVTIANTGNASLTIPPPTMGTNPSIAAGFQYDSASTCPQLSISSSGDTLNPGASCTLAIDFVPVTGGSISGSMVLTDNSLNAAAPNYTQQTIALSGTAVQVTLTPATLPGGSYGTAYNQTVTASGGTAPYTYVLSSGTLPQGLTLNNGTGVLGGTPTAAGPYSFAITATDANGFTGTQSYTLTISQVTSTITWATPAAISYGTVLSATQLNASSSVGGSFTYSPAAGTVLPAGPHTLTATFTPTDTTDYTTATATVTLTVNQVTPTITWATPTAISYGTALGATQLNASSSVGGSFTYSSGAGAELPAGPHTLTATFTPTDATDYTTATATVTLTVNQVTPTITWATPTAIIYGTTLSSTQLNASSSVGGSFTYSSGAGMVLPAGPHTLTATFTPTDTTDYTTATATVTLTVNQVTPTITWATPAAISYGTALGATQLNASSSVGGSFTYSSGAGMVLPAGPHTLTATFTPTDTTDYTTATATVTLTVNQAALTITANSATRAYGAANPTFTGTYAGAVNGDSFTVAGTTTATAASAANSYGIVPTVTGANLANYTVTIVNGTLTVSQAALTVTANSATRAYGVASPAFTGTYTGAVNGDSFTVTGTTTATAASAVGTYSIVPTVTGANVANYTVTTVNGSLTISQAVLTITANSATRAYGAANPTFTGTYTGAVNGDSFTVADATSATAASTVGTYSIVPTVTGANVANYTVTAVNGSLTISQAVLTITANSATRAYGAANPTFTGTYTGTAVNGDSFIVAGTTSATAASTVGTYSIVPTVIGANLANYTVTTVNGSLTISPAMLTITANSATRAYGAANPSFTGTVTGQEQGGAFTESFTTTATSVSPVGSYAIVPSVTGASLSDYSTSVNNGTLAITPAMTSTTLSASNTAPSAGATVTLTATVVSSTSGTPTGSVSFYDGTTLLGTASLSSGSASCATSTLAAGASHLLSAVYSGDTNFTTSSTTDTAIVVVTPAVFNLSRAPASGIGSVSQPVIPGQPAAFSFAISPGAAGYPGVVNFSVSGLPTGWTAKFSPSSLAPNAGAQTVTLTVQTTATTAGAPAPLLHGRGFTQTALALLLLPLAGVRRLRRKGRRLESLLCLVVLAGVAMASSLLTGCGTSNGYFGQARESYALTITVTSGAVQQQTTVTLNEQ